MGKVTLDIEDNVDEVIADVEQHIQDLADRMADAMKSIMSIVKSEAQRYVRKDAELSGELRRSIRMADTANRNPYDFKVWVRPSKRIAEYAAIVEFGSGAKTNEITPKANSAHPHVAEDHPSDFPYSAPDIGEPKMSNPKFSAFVKHIKDWMVDKNIQPEKDSLQASAQAITHEIVTQGTYAHPYLRPAWFDHEVNIRNKARSVIEEVFA